MEYLKGLSQESKFTKERERGEEEKEEVVIEEESKKNPI